MEFCHGATLMLMIEKWAGVNEMPNHLFVTREYHTVNGGDNYFTYFVVSNSVAKELTIERPQLALMLFIVITDYALAL